MIFWDIVQNLVYKQNTTFRWLSDKLGISETTVSGWRRTNVLPRADHAVVIAKALGVTVEYLVNGDSPAAKNLFASNSNPLIDKITKDLHLLTDEELVFVSVQVAALAVGAKSRQAKQA